MLATTFVGLDVHKRWINVAIILPGSDTPVEWRIAYLLAIEQIEERLKNLLVHIERLAIDPRYANAVATLRCFRSFETITAVGLAVELHNFERFTAARRLMSFVGLIPGEHSSGETRRQGSITKTGNSHVRRLLIEAAWNYRHHPHVGRALRERRKGHPPGRLPSPIEPCTDSIAATSR
jgi:transposase